MLAPGLCQIAFSVTDLRRTHRWYRDLLGVEPAGGTNLFFGPTATEVQGVPGAASTCWWLVDRQDFVQPMARASAFKKPCLIPARDAAERIYTAILERRPTLHFPLASYLQVSAARLLPARLRDQLTRNAMSVR